MSSNNNKKKSDNEYEIETTKNRTRFAHGGKMRSLKIVKVSEHDDQFIHLYFNGEKLLKRV